MSVSLGNRNNPPVDQVFFGAVAGGRRAESDVVARAFQPLMQRGAAMPALRVQPDIRVDDARSALSGAMGSVADAAADPRFEDALAADRTAVRGATHEVAGVRSDGVSNAPDGPDLA